MRAEDKITNHLAKYIVRGAYNMNVHKIQNQPVPKVEEALEITGFLKVVMTENACGLQLDDPLKL